MKRFEKIAKRYALANSYFKNRLLIWPDTLCEIHDYLQQHGELPFRYDGDNWSYDALCERQKRRGVRLSQYLTPDATARRIAALAVRYFENDSRIMDVCCGTGQLTRALIAEGVHPSQIVGLEVDRELADFYARLYPVTQTLIGPYRDIDFRNFKQYMKISPAQYILSLRMVNAQSLLENTEYNIGEIAEIVGYDNPLYFSRVFKKEYGVSPAQYRKNLEESTEK
jgi:phospholipid N-methyltransferase